MWSPPLKILQAIYKTATNGSRRVSIEPIYSEKQERDFRKKHALAESIEEMKAA